MQLYCAIKSCLRSVAFSYYIIITVLNRLLMVIRYTTMKFAEGEEVLAKHSSTDSYMKGTVLSMRGDRYKVKFESGIEQYVHSNDIKVNRPSRNVVRTSVRTRKSPSRYSPSRRSPSRRSPHRRSPSANKQSGKGTKFAKVSLPRIEIPSESRNNDIINMKNTDNDNASIESLSRMKETGVVTRRSTRLLSLKPESELSKTVLLARNIDRAVSLPLEKKSLLHDSISDEKVRGFSVQRDQDLLKTLHYEKDVAPTTEIIEKRRKEISMVNEPQEWGGWFGTLVLIILMPLITILPQLMCSETKCTFGYPKIPKNINSYLNLESLAAYLGLFLFVTIVSCMPIGQKIDGLQSRVERLQYHLNGFFCGVLSLIVFGVFVYKDFQVSDLIIDNYVQFSISGWILGVIISLFLYIKGGRAPVANLNMYGSSKSVIYNFWQGREINPRIGPVDFKINLFRTSMITIILINASIMIKAYKEFGAFSIEHPNIAVFLGTGLQILYAADALFFEYAMLTTFEVMYEGTGYMLCTGYMLYPFLATLTTKYMLYHKTKLTYLFIFPVLGVIIGYLLYRISNLKKNEFRRNPLSRSLAQIETIPTVRGKKLMVSGLWGHVRHPNYLGDIIMWWSLSSISLACDILPYYYAIICTGLLIHRAIRDNERCKLRYGLAWEEYTSRVKYMILYRIF